ncbi:hypothetical protein [Streptomyces sp. YIM S03343]
MPNTTPPPTLAQLLNLVDRAERKGGLNVAEGTRLRVGLHALAEQHGPVAGVVVIDSSDLTRLRRKYNNLRKRVHASRRKDHAVGTEPTPPPDAEAHAAVQRVTTLAQRWTHIPAKRAAAASVLAAITNKDPDD